jgi:acetoin utilization deacetylase AcuC-like enzyme
MVMRGELANGFALLRPPGHHADSEAAQGFCLFNNVAVAAKVMLERFPTECKRILIVDWDVHHGNGTQNLVYESNNILYFSIHRYHFYPLTGHIDECGEGKVI